MRKCCETCKHNALVASEQCRGCERIRTIGSGEDWSAPSHWEMNPMTNADRIRAMTDEELGIFLAEWAEKPLAWKRDGEGECLYWLQQPAEGD